MSTKTQAFLKVAAAYIIWSFMGVILNTSTFTPFQNIFFSDLLVLIVILLIPSLRRQLNFPKKFTFSKDILIFMLAAGTSGVIWLNALTLLPIAQAVLLYSSLPFFAFLLEIGHLKEKFDVKRLCALLVGLVGVFLILAQGIFHATTHGFLFGASMVLLAAFLQAVSGIYNKKISPKYSLITVIALIVTSQVIVSFPLTFLHPWIITPYAILASIGLGIVATLLGFFLYVGAFHVLKTSSIMLVGYIEPFFAAIWGYIFLSQSLSPLAAIGGIIILTAGYWMVKLEHRKN